jgi:hypothetical protein
MFGKSFFLKVEVKEKLFPKKARLQNLIKL